MLLSVVIDSPPSHANHGATLAALDDALDHAGVVGEIRVVRTPDIDAGFLAYPGHGILIGPGAPFENPSAAESVIEMARQRGVPLVGT